LFSNEGNGGKTVVYTDMRMHASKENTTVNDTTVDDYLVKAGISRLFVGHVPQGDCPKLIRASSGIEVFACDVSYSDMKKANDPIAPDNRGQAISMVWIDNGGTTVVSFAVGLTHHPCAGSGARLIWATFLI
jgi:hypothetical protein